MATLTDPELVDIRLIVGDDCTPPALDDDQVQVLYDAADGNLCATYVAYLERLWGPARRDPKNLVTLGNGATFNQKAKTISDQIAYYRKKCGIADELGTLTVGTLLLDIDTTWDNLETDLANENWP